MFFKKLKAISYVEVLLTLVIVGVISSLAIPALKKYSQREELGRQAQKAYLTLNEAMDMSIIDNGPAYKWKHTNISNSFNKYLVPYLKVARTISTSQVLTKDNMKFSSYTAQISPKVVLNVTVDVNGDKGPNKSGKDIFTFGVDFAEGKVTPNNDVTRNQISRNKNITNLLYKY